MPFKEIAPVFAGERGRSSVRFGVRVGKKGAVTGIVVIPKATLDELGWAEGDNLRLLLGDGSDDGVIRLEKVHRGPITLGRLHRYDGLSARLGCFAGLPKHTVKARNAVHEVKDGGLEVDLPLEEKARPDPPRPVVSPMAVRPQPQSRPPLRDPR